LLHLQQLPEVCFTEATLQNTAMVRNMLLLLMITGVLWGYFIFMAVKSVEGSQLWERLLLLVTDPKKRVAIMQQEHAAYMQVRLAACQHWCNSARHVVHLVPPNGGLFSLYLNRTSVASCLAANEAGVHHCPVEAVPLRWILLTG
jgi:hypothetical protein